jgi:outer membrane protein
MMRRIAGLVAAGTLLLAAGMPAFGADFVSDMKSAKGWTVTVGAVGKAAPVYEGSDKYTFQYAPIFALRPMGTAPRWFSNRDSIGITLFEAGKFEVGPVANLIFKRKVKNDPAGLNGLTDVDTAFEAGLFAQYWFTDFLRYRVEARQGFGGHHGIVLDQAADFVMPFGQWILSAGPRMRIATEAANSPYFDVSFAQSLTSSLPVYDAGGGIRSVGGGGQAIYRLNPQWALHGFVEYDRLVSDVANSPIVRIRGSADQWQIGGGVAYSFDWVR